MVSYKIPFQLLKMYNFYREESNSNIVLVQHQDVGPTFIACIAKFFQLEEIVIVALHLISCCSQQWP